MLMPVQPLQLLLSQRAVERADEIDDLAALLMQHANTDIPAPQAQAMADRIARACLSDRHLWEDLELPSRAALGALMHARFAPLIALNAQGMRWKKFLYRQLCIQHEVLICRSASCAACDEVARCFGPEEPTPPQQG